MLVDWTLGLSQPISPPTPTPNPNLIQCGARGRPAAGRRHGRRRRPGRVRGRPLPEGRREADGLPRDRHQPAGAHEVGGCVGVCMGVGGSLLWCLSKPLTYTHTYVAMLNQPSTTKNTCASATSLLPSHTKNSWQDLKDFFRPIGDVGFTDVDGRSGEGVVEFMYKVRIGDAYSRCVGCGGPMAVCVDGFAYVTDPLSACMHMQKTPRSARSVCSPRTYTITPKKTITGGHEEGHQEAGRGGDEEPLRLVRRPVFLSLSLRVVYV